MSLAGITPPDKSEVLSIDEDGMAKIRRSVAEVEAHGWGDIGEVEKERLRAMLTEMHVTGGPFSVGGHSAWTQKELVPAKKLWTRDNEKKEFRNFLQLRRKWMNETIPIEKEALKTKMLTKYGTTDPSTFERVLNEGMKGNARLSIKTRRGIIKTSVVEQKQFSAQCAQSMEMPTKP